VADKFILVNPRNVRISFEIFDMRQVPEGTPHWRRQRMIRQGKFLNIEPHSSVDLCGPPWNLTPEDAVCQPNVISFRAKGYVQLLGVEVKPDGPKPSIQDSSEVATLTEEVAPKGEPEGSTTDDPPSVDPVANTEPSPSNGKEAAVATLTKVKGIGEVLATKLYSDHGVTDLAGLNALYEAGKVTLTAPMKKSLQSLLEG